MATIFVTGTTGFLGSHFLINFVGTHFDRAYVLIRGTTDEVRRGKLITALRQAAEELERNIGAIQSSTKQTAASSDELAGASRTLAALAENLKKLVQFFRW